jgi:PadR family transcriptional regulator PadR
MPTRMSSSPIMSPNTPHHARVDLLQGTLDMLVLRTLVWGPQHGHGVGQSIRHSSADLLHIERGSLYPALHRLEAQGLIASEWRASDSNRRAKYYRLTPAGKRQLVSEQSKWKRLVKTIARVMRTTVPAERP